MTLNHKLDLHSSTLRRYLDASHVNCVLRLVAPVLRDARFHHWPASLPGKDGQPPKHHGETGGLSRHTNEVLAFALGAATSHAGNDRIALAVGAIWHDIGKIREYAVTEAGVWFRATPLVSHICHGLQQWQSACDLLGDVPPQLKEHVTHMIASHHGRKEWGSPVVPSTLEALILHSADCQSLMLDGADNPAFRLP